MEIHVDALLLLLEALLGLLHVVVDRVVGDVRLALGPVVELGRGDERPLERLLVHLEVLPVDVGLVDAERDERLDELLEQRIVDRLAVPVPLDDFEDRRRELGLAVAEEVVAPGDERELAR